MPSPGNDAAFATVALAPVQERGAEAAVRKAAEWLLGGSDTDGGLNWKGPGAPSEVDLTGAAIEALVAAGEQGTAAPAAAASSTSADRGPTAGRSAAPRVRLST